MFKRIKKAKLGRKASHKRLLIRNLLRSLFTNGYLTTTTLKAKTLKDEAMKLMNDLKKPNMFATKKASMTLGSRELVERIVKYLGGNDPVIKIVKIGYRDGDKAETTRVSVVGYAVKKDKKVVKEEVKDEKKVVAKEDNKIEKKTKSIGKSIRENVSVRKERARTRSGI